MEPSPMHPDEFVAAMTTYPTFDSTPPPPPANIDTDGFAESILLSLLENPSSTEMVPTLLMLLAANIECFRTSCKRCNVASVLIRFPAPSDPLILEVVTLAMACGGGGQTTDHLFPPIPQTHRAAVNFAVWEVLNSTNQSSLLVDRAVALVNYDALHFLLCRTGCNTFDPILALCASHPEDGIAMATLVGKLLVTPGVRVDAVVLQAALLGALSIPLAHSVCFLTQLAIVPNNALPRMSNLTAEAVAAHCFTDPRYAPPLAVLAGQHTALANCVALSPSFSSYLLQTGHVPLVSAVHTYLLDIAATVDFLSSSSSSSSHVGILADVLRAGARARLTSPLRSSCLDPEARVVISVFCGGDDDTNSLLLDTDAFRPFVEMFQTEYVTPTMASHDRGTTEAFDDYAESLMAAMGMGSQDHLTAVLHECLIPFRAEVSHALLVAKWGMTGSPANYRNARAWFRGGAKSTSSIENVSAGLVMWQGVVWPELEARGAMLEYERMGREGIVHLEQHHYGKAFPLCPTLSFVLAGGETTTEEEDEVALLQGIVADGGAYAEVARGQLLALQGNDVVWLSRLARHGYAAAVVPSGEEVSYRAEVELSQMSSQPRHHAALLARDVVALSGIIRERLAVGSCEALAVELCMWSSWEARCALQCLAYERLAAIHREQVQEEETKAFAAMKRLREEPRQEVSISQLDKAQQVDLHDGSTQRIATLESLLAERTLEVTALHALLATADNEMISAQDKASYHQHMLEKTAAELCRTQTLLSERRVVASNATEKYDAERLAFDTAKLERRKLQREVEAMSTLAARDRGCIQSLLKYGRFMVSDNEDNARTKLERQYVDDYPAMACHGIASVGCGTSIASCEQTSQTHQLEIAQGDVYTARSFLEALSRGQHVSAFRSYTAGMPQSPSEHAWVTSLFRRVPPPRVVSGRLFRVVWPVDKGGYTTEVVCEIHVDGLAYVVPAVLSVRLGKVVDVAFAVDIEAFITTHTTTSRPHTAAARVTEGGSSVPRGHRNAVEKAKNMYQTS